MGLQVNKLAAIIAGLGSSPSSPAVVTMMSAVTLRGVTFNFDREMPVCFSCLGEPAVISTESFNITSITPNSDLVETSSGSGVFRAANGTMINPTGMLMSQQGFDGLIGDYVSTSDITPYSSTLNKDPALSTAISVAAGQEMSVVKSVRVSGLTAVSTSGSGYRTVDKYVILTVLDSVPSAGFFRPPPAGTVKLLKNNWREDLVDYSVLQSLAPVSGQITIAEAETLIRPTLPFFYPNGNGERFRRLNTEGSTDTNAEINYSRDFGISRGNALSVLHTNISNESKRTVFLRAIQHGIDLHGEIVNGFTGAGGAGQGYGRQEFPYYAAFALKDSDVLASARAQQGSTLSQHFWVSEQDVGRNVYWPAPSSQQRFNCATYLSSDLALPEWEQEPSSDIRARNASLLSRYREFWQAGILGAFGVCLLKNGPGSIDGVTAILNGTSDSSNPRAASLNYYDRINSIPNTLRVFSDWVGWKKLFRDTYRNLISLPNWTGKPDMVEYANNASNYNQNVTAGAGQISYNFSAADVFTTLPLTRHDVRYSLDGVDWVEVNNTGASTGVITGLTPGLAHEVSYRRWNSAGASRWSPTYAFTASGGPFPTRRNRVAPTGTPANAAPVNTVSPKVFRNPFPVYQGELYEEAPATLSEAFMRQPRKVLTASLGYWTGFPAPTFTYQWRANGSPIAGATSKDLPLNWFTVDSDVIDCQITASNSQGSVTATTNAVTVPTEIEPILPATLNVVSNIKQGIANATRLLKATALENTVNGRKGTFAMRGRLLGGDGTNLMFYAQGVGTSSVTDCVRIQRLTTNQIRMTLRSASAQVLQQTSVGTLLAGSDFELLISWDLDLGVSQMWLNGVSVGGAPTLGTVADIPYTSTLPANFFGLGNNTALTPAQWSYVYLNTSAYVDLSVATNRDKFLPANIGGWGDEPTGSRPQVFLWGDAESYNTGLSNKGIGGIVEPNLIYSTDENIVGPLNDIIDV